MEIIKNIVAGCLFPQRTHSNISSLILIFENLASPFIKRLSLTSLPCWTWVRFNDSLLTNAADTMYRIDAVWLLTPGQKGAVASDHFSLWMLTLGTQPPCCEGAKAAHVASPLEEAHAETETPTEQQSSTAPLLIQVLIKQAFRWFQPQPLSLSAEAPDIIEQI